MLPLVCLHRDWLISRSSTLISLARVRVLVIMTKVGRKGREGKKEGMSNEKARDVRSSRDRTWLIDIHIIRLWWWRWRG